MHNAQWRQSAATGLLRLVLLHVFRPIRAYTHTGYRPTGRLPQLYTYNVGSRVVLHPIKNEVLHFY